MIPILIDHARMPGRADLPPSLTRLAFRNAIEVDQGRDFHPHVDRLVQGIEFHFQTPDASRRPEPAVSGRLVGAPLKRRNIPWLWLYVAALTLLALLGVIIYIPKPPVTNQGGDRKAASPAEKPQPPPPQPEQERTKSIGIELVRIEGGALLMGTTKDQVDQLMRLFPDIKPEWLDREQPAHLVRLSKPFYLGIHEVTQGQYEAVMGSNPSQFKGSDDLPVENVSWLDAVTFCDKLSEREKRTPFYRIDGTEVTVVGGNGYRLPTEAEWEYACRAKSTTLYPFGDHAGKLGECAWYSSNSESKTHPVGQKLPNAWGLYDMLGNVCEWCADGYDEKYDASPPPADPPGASGASHRVVRGGGWSSFPWYCRPADRNRRAPGGRFSFLGFRVAAVQE
ncbi:MAG: formylglycine-generating enzyme family protein [Isosphaerales bacterium]